MTEQAIRLVQRAANGVQLQSYLIHLDHTWGRDGKLKKRKGRFAWYHSMPTRATYGSGSMTGLDEAIAYLVSLGYEKEEVMAT